MIKNLFALMDEDRIVYTVGMYKGHAFRVYPDGRIGKANSQEQELAKRKENNKMKVIIKLCGEYIATAFMTSSEIHNAQNAGFTILRKGKEK